MEKLFSWTIQGGRTLGPAPFFVVGIVNTTPDSFFDGGTWNTQDAAVSQGLKLAKEGAAILDIGGESTRPGAEPVPVEEELRRVVPVITALKEHFAGKNSSPSISIDSYKAETAAQALAAGAEIVNDVSACSFDPALADVLAEHKPGYVLMHSLGRPQEMQKAPRYRDVCAEIADFFEERMAFLVKKGLPEDRVVLDPGIGFGKTLEHNLEILKNIAFFERLGRPLYMGLSNKSLWEKLLGLAVQERGRATAVATALMYAKGVGIHRVHDAAAAVEALGITHALK
jgi:dihydropteroate synthase